MSDEALLQRITLNPAVLAGKPVIAGTRFSAEFIVSLLAHGAEQEILAEYSRLTSKLMPACSLPRGRCSRCLSCRSSRERHRCASSSMNRGPAVSDWLSRQGHDFDDVLDSGHRDDWILIAKDRDLGDLSFRRPHRYGFATDRGERVANKILVLGQTSYAPKSRAMSGAIRQ